MLRAVALVPSPPLLVPELTGRGAPESTAVRDASLAAARTLGALADRWFVVSAAQQAYQCPPHASGSFSGYGADVRVALSPDGGPVDTDMPLAALIAGWLRGEVAPRATVLVRFVDASATPSQCRAFGRELRAEMDADVDPCGLLVVGDGATTLTPKAPGALDERAEGIQQLVDDALAVADHTALAALDRPTCLELGMNGVAAWQTLGGVMGEDRPATSTLYRGAPFGVGYFVGTWELHR